VPFLGAIPIDVRMVGACDDGVVFVQNFSDSEAALAIGFIVGKIIQVSEGRDKVEGNNTPNSKQMEESRMKVAIPLANGKLAMHFGHCEQFAIIEVDGTEIKSTETLIPPQHEPGVLPKWLNEKGANVIISGGMGQRAQNLFTQSGIKVVVGASADTPESIVRSFIDGNLQTGDNICDH